LGELTMPVTLLVGERDRKFVDIAVLMAQRISQAEVVIVPGVGHAAHLEAPHAVADVIAGDPSNL
jgi:pimeloyl-ACP methyl ester carboxylesterase